MRREVEKGESGTVCGAHDHNIVCSVYIGRRAWASVWSVSVFTTKTLGVQHQDPRRFSRLLWSNSTWVPLSLLFLEFAGHGLS